MKTSTGLESTNVPKVALESTVITHGLPRPVNLQIAREMEASVRAGGAIAYMMAVLAGDVKVGLSDAQLVDLAQREGVRKCSMRDLPLMKQTGEYGGTTVSATLFLSLRAGIPVFATGGIGGVHRGDMMDVSADLPALAQFPGTVVCAGAKSILDLPRTRERLETDGVTVLGWQCDEFPSFYSRDSGLEVDQRVESAAEVARIMQERDRLGLSQSILVTVPCPEGFALPQMEMEDAIEQAEASAFRAGVVGKALTPYLLNHLAEATKGRSLAANRALLRNNARVAAEIACAFSKSDV
ncbi:pseudouridine-5'-phosphate glycosidase [Kiritimatiellota bacterium B12222]|nr:pseudouridine-5'-phosphate glycosidase [Kiritimatiellota bacterium B12222]